MFHLKNRLLLRPRLSGVTALVLYHTVFILLLTCAGKWHSQTHYFNIMVTWTLILNDTIKYHLVELYRRAHCRPNHCDHVVTTQTSGYKTGVDFHYWEMWKLPTLLFPVIFFSRNIKIQRWTTEDVILSNLTFLLWYFDELCWFASISAISDQSLVFGKLKQ